MDLRHMRHFVVVAEELHFGRAARRLNMAQPPLSQSIQRLEANLGVQLFDRSKRSVELTASGRAFLVEARQTLLQADVARKIAQRAAETMPEVRVSFIGPALFQVLPDLLVAFHVAHPGVHVRLIERSSPEQLEGMRSGDFDVGFITAGLPHSGFEALLVERARFVAAVPATSPLADRALVGLQELAEQPFLLPPRKYAAGSDTLDLFKHAGVIPHVAQESSQTNTTLSLVGAGLGCSLVMATAALTTPRNVVFLPISDPLPQARWELAMAWRADRVGEVARNFIAFATDYVKANPQLLDLDRTASFLVTRNAGGDSAPESRAKGRGGARTRRA